MSVRDRPSMVGDDVDGCDAGVATLRKTVSDDKRRGCAEATTHKVPLGRHRLVRVDVEPFLLLGGFEETLQYGVRVDVILKPQPSTGPA